MDDRELVELLVRREEQGADELLRCYGPMPALYHCAYSARSPGAGGVPERRGHAGLGSDRAV